jgi:cyclopropane fatty-acyl-phospholipid synthase-like methyltransferase
MQAWMEGYESDIEYTTGYYREQEPSFLNLCAVIHGIEPINLENGFTYCELGCGQGMTALIMAANYPMGKFYAVDFNPSHIARARNLAAQAGLDNVVFLEKSFAQLAEDPSLLPDCDFIALHGIFTWVSDENRQCIIDICSRHLKSGGMVYNSYNAKPGWSMGEPLQKMLFAAGKMFSGNSISRFDQSLALIKRHYSKIPHLFQNHRTI